MKKLALILAVVLTACPKDQHADVVDAVEVVDVADVSDSDFDALEGSAMPPEMDAQLDADASETE